MRGVGADILYVDITTMIRVHSTESFGTMDGPGIRLIVFVQGCRFRCLYCQNPDTQDMFGGKEMSPAEIMQRVEKERPYFGGDGGITISGGEPTLQAKNLIPLFKLAQRPVSIRRSIRMARS